MNEWLKCTNYQRLVNSDINSDINPCVGLSASAFQTSMGIIKAV